MDVYRGLAASLAWLIIWQPVLLWAQQGAASQATLAAEPVQTQVRAGAMPDFDRLGIDLQRIKRALAERPPSRSTSPLKLDFYVEVVGIAPPIRLFTREDLAPGPVPGGPPTHADMLNVMTRPEFRTGTVPLSSLAILAAQKLIEWQKKK